jgi:hypothetical protein
MRSVLASTLDAGALSLLDHLLELELEAHGMISGTKVSHAVVLPRWIRFPHTYPLGDRWLPRPRPRGRSTSGN